MRPGLGAAVALSVLALAPLCAGEAAPPRSGGGVAASAPLIALWHQRDVLPRWSGLLLILLGLIPLLQGWTLIRWSMALACAGGAGGAVLAVTAGSWDAELAWTAALALAVLGGLAGFFLYQAAVAAQGALACFALLYPVACALAPGHGELAAAVGGLGALGGCALGWWVAPLLGIAETVALGALLVLDGMGLVVEVESDAELRLLSALVLPLTILPGLIVQLRAHRRSA